MPDACGIEIKQLIPPPGARRGAQARPQLRPGHAALRAQSGAAAGTFGAAGLGAAGATATSPPRLGWWRGGRGRARPDRGFARRHRSSRPASLPAPHFAFMKSKFFMNHLYFSSSSPMSLLLHSVAGREVSRSAGALPGKPKVAGCD